MSFIKDKICIFQRMSFIKDKNSMGAIVRKAPTFGSAGQKICEICEICVRLKLFFCVNSAPLREDKSFCVNSSSCSSSSFLDNYLAVLFEKCNFAAGIFIEKCSF